jgi:hypothetical protein
MAAGVAGAKRGPLTASTGVLSFAVAKDCGVEAELLSVVSSEQARDLPMRLVCSCEQRTARIASGGSPGASPS